MLLYFKTIITIIIADLMKFVKTIGYKRISCIRAGDTITVYYEIKEGEKTRTQFLKVVIKEEVLVTQKLYYS
jgi:ribosomal protein L19